MKRILSLLLSAVLCLSITSCDTADANKKALSSSAVSSTVSQVSKDDPESSLTIQEKTDRAFGTASDKMPEPESTPEVFSTSAPTPDPTPTPEPPLEEPVVQEQEEEQAEQVLVTPTGAKYHLRKCGRGSYSYVSIDEAISRGLEPCSKCY